jgi:hypothetical protein
MYDQKSNFLNSKICVHESNLYNFIWVIFAVVVVVGFEVVAAFNNAVAALDVVEASPKAMFIEILLIAIFRKTTAYVSYSQSSLLFYCVRVLCVIVNRRSSRKS